MFLLIGIVLIPIVIVISIMANKPAIKKRVKVLLNALLLVISFFFITGAFITNLEPFDFHDDITETADYIFYFTLIFIVTPFLWCVLYHFCKKLFKSIRVQKNAKMKKNAEYQYRRDDLNKIPPNVVMFTSIMETDIRKSLTATILKLKLTGHIEEINNDFQCTVKDTDELLESEKLVLDLIRYDTIDLKLYSKLIEQEAVRLKYVKKNTGGVFWKIVKMLITLCVPAVMIITCIKYDNYITKEHKTWILDGVRYVKINNSDTVWKIYNCEKTNIKDYYHRYVYVYDEEYGYNYDLLSPSYSYNLIRADRFQYGVVWLHHALHISCVLYYALCIIAVFAALFFVFEQIRYFNKNYKRTLQGNNLLNEAYALKNFLKDFTTIQERAHEEIIIYEYYLIYAVILDLNVKAGNEIIDKYLSQRTM